MTDSEPSRPPATSEPSTIGAYALAIRKALDMADIDSQALFQEAGIKQMPSNDPLDRIPIATIAQLLRLAVRETGDPAFGLVVARYVHPSTLHALGYALLASSSLRDCCQRIENYFRLVSEGGSLSIVEQDERIKIAMTLHTDRVAVETIDAWNAFVVRLFRLIYKPDFAPLQVDLQRPCPAGYEAIYQKSFHAPINYDAPVSAIYVSAEDFDAPLDGANREIALQSDQIAGQYLVRLDKADIVSLVRNEILKALPSGRHSKTEIARHLHMSPSTLQLKLTEKGTSYHDLLNDLRKSVALSYLEDTRTSITEIGFLLGFTDTSSFTRAFRRWTGKSPTEYRGDS